LKNLLEGHKFPLNQGEQEYYHDQQVYQNYKSGSRDFLTLVGLILQHTGAWHYYRDGAELAVRVVYSGTQNSGNLATPSCGHL